MKQTNTARAVVAERGQVTIPKVIRDKLGIRPGVVLNFELRDNTIIVSKDLTSDPIASIYGCLKGATGYASTDEYLKEIRGAAE